MPSERDQLQRDRARDRLAAADHAEFRRRIAQVESDRALADAEQLADFPPGLAF